MNPPSALQSAMNRERKPFTYLPGGLDLSEIKSQRMAERLMRNAMNPGVSELPSQNPHAQTTPTTTIPVPNFNCLPVQVFPAFQLPANPKSLLRTRSTPDPKMPSFLNPKSNTVNAKFEVNKPMVPSSQVNNGSLNSTKPDVCYENNSKPLQVHNNNPFEEVGCGTVLPEMEYVTEYHNAKPLRDLNNIVLPSSYINNSSKGTDDKNAKTPIETTTLAIHSPPLLLTLDDDASNNDQKEIKTSIEEATKEISKLNGDAEAAITVKLPSKKSEAKTETKVDVVKKTLPDGSLQEITTTTTTTTVDGKTEIKTRTQTKTFPKEVVEEEEVEESEEEVEEDQQNNEDKRIETEDNKNSIITTEERSESKTTKKVTIVQNSNDGETNEREESVEPEKESYNDDKESSHENVEIEEVEEINGENQESVQIIDDEQNEVETETQKPQVENTEAEVIKEEHIDSEEEYEEAEEVENIKHSATEPESSVPLLQSEDQDESEYTEEEYESEVEEENKIAEKNSNTSELSQEEKEVETKATAETEQDDNQNVESIVVVENQEKVIENAQVEETSNEEIIETVKEDVKSETNESLVESTEKPETADSCDKDTEQQTAQKTENVPKEEHEIKVELQQETQEEKLTRPQPRVQFREPSVPLEKVEDVEIKPITGQDFVSKSTVEKTEIITRSNEQPKGILSKQTEYNRVENIVTVNRSTKTLDRQLDSYVPAHFPVNNVAATPQAYTPYQPTNIPDPTTERRHSLLLERLSVDRQLPITEIYSHPYSSQASEQKQWSEEPQSEVLTINNVKPSMITKNQQWYQNTKENVTSSNTEQSSTYQPWVQQQQTQPIHSQYQPPQSQYQPAQPQYVPPQPQYAPPQPQYQVQQPEYTPPQPLYLSQYQPKPQQCQQQQQFQSQLSPQPQPQYQPQPTYQSQYKTQPQTQYKPQTLFKPQPPVQPEQHYQSSYTESRSQETKSSSTFKPNVQLNSYPKFTPKPDWNTNSQSYEQNNQYTGNTDYYTPETYGSSYVPPPWEQDSKYVADSNLSNYEPSPISGLSPTSNQSWTPTPKSNKYNKTTPKSYIPPAPNQSFVKPVTASQPKVAGRKTYYSEYERRYISVPESTYIPAESKFQHQPDPSPVYYYNTEDSAEPAEPEWRKELREFTEKTTKTETHIESSVRPPWEGDKQVKSPAPYTPTPTWSQTLQPRSNRERSFEAERYSGVQEWPKTNTIGRGRPLSTYEKSDYESPVQRVRGVSVDRYNPNNYQSPSPAEHPPVQSQTLTAENAPHKHYHNPSVPAYHASRASAEPRDPASFKQQRVPVDPRNAPFQSRSFKYLQWITGTED